MIHMIKIFNLKIMLNIIVKILYGKIIENFLFKLLLILIKIVSKNLNCNNLKNKGKIKNINKNKNLILKIMSMGGKHSIKYINKISLKIEDT
jgi:hypothetical protein